MELGLSDKDFNHPLSIVIVTLIDSYNHMKSYYILLLALVFGTVFSSSTIPKKALADDMMGGMGGDAPATSDTITAGPTGDGDEDEDEDGDGDDSQSDGMPPPGDAPATTDALTTGGGSDNDDDDDDDNEDDDSDSDNEPVPNNKAATGSALTAKKIECPKGQEVSLFSATCDLIQPPGNTQCDETAEQAALTPSPDPSSSLPPAEIDTRNQCVPDQFGSALQLGISGNFPGDFLQSNSELEREPENEIVIEPENEEGCIAATAAAEQCSTVTPTPTPAPSGTESNNNQPNK
jgi:hypothetical protein